METYVVRAWRDDPVGDTTPDDSLRGVVEHVATGASARFTDADELLTFLRARPAPGGEPEA